MTELMKELKNRKKNLFFNYSEFNEVVDYYCYGVGSY